MKKLFLSILSLAVLAGCSKDSSGSDTPQIDMRGKAFMALNLLNGSTSTRAENTEDPGSEAESKASVVTVLLFDEANTCLGSINASGLTVGNSDGNISTALPSEPFLVPATTKRIFVAINPAAGWDLSDATVKNKSWNQINATLDNVAVTAIATDNKFAMASAGALATGALTDVSGNIVKPISQKTDDLAAAKVEAKAKAASIKVDRLAAKITVKKNAAISVKPDGAAFEFNGWELNVTNKSAKLYTELEPYTGTVATVAGVYRRDKNFTVAEQPTQGADGAAMKAEFNYLANEPLSDVQRAENTSAYCIENTMAADAQQLGYTTKVVVKAQYTPQGFTAKSSYFFWNGNPYTLAALKAEYAKTAAGGLKKDLPEFLLAAKLLTSEDVTDGKTDAVVAALEDASFSETTGIIGRYQAVRYYHQSVCYYDVLVRHDQSVIENMALGRYGVVRNNWYSLSIDAVSKPGTPWIPDPTDPKDPTDPTTPDDQDEVYLSVSITINPWVMWSQSVELN